ncbi:putative permease [Pirellulimonas nuda]|uniref:Putative permease n=1 Tax=Pirellulimonas nuda TaxID=2528009 RepID=A0A518D6I4_9BACT|nr:permease [Pirellulimonas nuda]QDU87065.1 putative permease [Pirellulimonas nuda]
MLTAELLRNTCAVLLELAPWLLLGALAAGLLHVALPEGWLRRQLQGRAGVVRAVAIGVPLPLCSCGVIPVALGARRAGASDGATVGFLVSTPQTGVDSVLVAASLLGWPLALFKVAAALVLGLIGGWATDATAPARGMTLPILESTPVDPRGWPVRLLAHALDMLRSIWRWVAAGVLASALITTLAPSDSLGVLSGYGGIGAMLIVLLIATPLYVCATASVPIAASLVAAGLPTGAALVFLMAGPATNVATIGAVYRVLGRSALVVYLAVTILGSLAAGLLFERLAAIAPPVSAAGHVHGGANGWSITSAVALTALFAWFAIDELRAWLGSSAPSDKHATCD